jgi:hypothetical protein
MGNSIGSVLIELIGITMESVPLCIDEHYILFEEPRFLSVTFKIPLECCFRSGNTFTLIPELIFASDALHLYPCMHLPMRISLSYDTKFKFIFKYISTLSYIKLPKALEIPLFEIKSFSEELLPYQLQCYKITDSNVCLWKYENDYGLSNVLPIEIVDKVFSFVRKQSPKLIRYDNVHGYKMRHYLLKRKRVVAIDHSNWSDRWPGDVYTEETMSVIDLLFMTKIH